MPLLSRMQLITAKIETTYGTDSTPAGTNAMVAFDMSLTPIEQETDTRDVQKQYLGDREIVVALNRAALEFSVELTGSGAAGTAPGFGALLRACGMSETIVASTSVTYAPISSTFESASIYFNLNGVQHKLLGARGTFSLDLQIKKIPKIKFKFTGLLGTITDAAMPTATFTGFGTPLAVNNTNTTGFQLHSFSGVMSAFSMEMGIAVNHRNLVGGSEYIQITDRDVNGSVTIEAPTIASKDFFTTAKTAASGNFTITHGTVAGNKVTVSGTKVQVANPKYTDLDGVAMLQMDLNFRPTSGNDEVSIALT